MANKHRDSLLEMVKLAEMLTAFAQKARRAVLRLAVQAVVNHGLAWMATLLRDADPNWLKELSEAGVVVTRFRDVCVALGGAMPGNWFLATQGLRSQRAALAQSDDPELQTLNSVWQALDQVANQINGQTSWKPQLLQLADDPNDAPLRSYSGEPASAKENLVKRWEILNKQKNELLKAASHKLPPQLNLGMLQVTERLQAFQAVVMLAPVADGNLMVMLVTKSVDTDGEKRRVGHQQWLLKVGAHRGRLAASTSTEFEAEELLTALHNHRLGLLAPNLRGTVTGPNGDTSPATTRAMRAGGLNALPDDLQTDAARASALAEAATYTAVLQAELAGLWAHLNSVGCTTVHWVVSGPLHSLPWRQLLATPTGSALRLKLYPHMAAWYQCNPPVNPLAVAQLPHWAALAYTPPVGDKDWLPFLAMEQALAAQLWAGLYQPMRQLDLATPQWPLADGADAPVNALFAAGHGNENPGANFALAGLLIGLDANGAQRFLQAQHLTRIKTAERVFLSCCVGAKTRHVMSEPLGLVAGAFDYGTRFAIGALVSVGDFDAMLFSLAYQWALRAAYEASLPQAEADWLAVFEATQDAVAAGHWPEGFGAWLEQAMPLLKVARAVSSDDCMARNARAKLHGVICGLKVELLTVNGSDQAIVAPWHGDWGDDLAALAQAIARRPSEYLRQLVHWYTAHGC